MLRQCVLLPTVIQLLVTRGLIPNSGTMSRLSLPHIMFIGDMSMLHAVNLSQCWCLFRGASAAVCLWNKCSSASRLASKRLSFADIKIGVLIQADCARELSTFVNISQFVR
jgi:hypothetical protein